MGEDTPIPAVTMDEATRIEQLEPPSGDVRMVLDTDTYNEIDDQFALVYSLLAPHLEVEAVYAAPFHNSRSNGPEDGMEKSYEEIMRLLDLVDLPEPAVPVEKGATQYLSEAGGSVENPASTDIIERAREYDSEEPLYVVAIGAPTNVSSALIDAPDIAEDIVVVWLGGQPLEWPHAREFNLGQDLLATRTLFDSGVPLVQVPCQHVAQHVRSSVPELEAHLAERGELAEYLLSIFKDYRDDPNSSSPWTKEIWDLAPIAYLINPDWVPSSLRHSPILSDDVRYCHDPGRHLIRVADTAHRDAIFGDVFGLLGE